MKLFKKFLVGIMAMSICVNVSAQSQSFDGNGSEDFIDVETSAIVLERARIRSELDAVNLASNFILKFGENLSLEESKAVAGRILDIQSSRIVIDNNQISSSFNAIIDSDKITNSLENIQDSVENQKLFRDRFEELETELDRLRKIPVESRNRDILNKIAENEKQISFIRNFIPISWAESAGSGSKRNLFGYIQNLTEAENGTLYFELKDPTSDSKIRCTLIARLNHKRPELKQMLEGNSPVYLYGMLTRFQGKISLMVWNVYL